MTKQYQLTLPQRQLLLGPRTLIMGILNVTPDSFSDGGQYFSIDQAIARAQALIAAGADIIDIGGESSRPGADPVSADEELARVLPVIEALAGSIEIPISIDTYKAVVAEAAIAAGAEIINDISALSFDPAIAKVAANTGAAVCLMHLRGTPKTMQQLPPSADIWSEIETDLTNAIERARAAGITGAQLLIDPGIGFGKSGPDNLKIIAELDRLNRFDLPILIGTSRKSFIGKLVKGADRLFGTAATVTAAILRGAHVVRVHDVAEMVAVVRVSDAIAQYARITEL